MTALTTLLRGVRTLGVHLQPAFIRQPVLSRGLRGAPPESAKTLEDKLRELSAADPVEARVDIGFRQSAIKNKALLKARYQLWKENKDDLDLAERSRSGTLKISYEEARQNWLADEAPNHVKEIADHYGIFKDLYAYGYFHPIMYLNVYYEHDAEHVMPVYHGNHILPSEASQAPSVSFDSEPDALWSLVLTSLDGHLLDNDKEYLHWFVGNIKGGNVANGEVVCDYMQPFLPRGTGYHRYVFVLYKQEGLIDYSKFKLPPKCTSLEQRTFKTHNFYEEHEKVLTPAGLAFFQCTWEDSLMDFFHNTLKMRAPTFEYVQPPEYIPKQVTYPHKEPFNIYLDKYRDPRDLREEVCLKRLRKLNPLEEEPPMPKYPNIYKVPQGTPSWLVDEMRKERFRIGKYRDLRPFSLYPEAEYEDPKEKALREQEQLEREWAEGKRKKPEKSP
ncbi:39S ribosomal protein L38, mitochondrial [Ixodes scapularis]|uniref:39S ribosomal protein L38, mitochondrial n=1 Tax=Ixodes scapularis TaxID=6945 RepID=UPI001C387CEE|nr:39S ribosomal protein L38, mitochondrial [Ixodes scapularis]